MAGADGGAGRRLGVGLDLGWGRWSGLATIPLVMARFHMLSIVGLVLNTLLWLPATLIVWSGLGLLALGATGAAPGRRRWAGAATGVWPCCNGGSTSARQLPAAYFWVPGPAEWWLVGFYGGLGLLAAFPRLRPPRRWCLALAAGWIAAGMLPSLLRHDPPRLKCTFLAVDHGLRRRPAIALRGHDALRRRPLRLPGVRGSRSSPATSGPKGSRTSTPSSSPIPMPTTSTRSRRLLERFSVGARVRLSQ